MDAEYDRKRARSLTSDETTSLDSFVSAPETPDLTDLEVILYHTQSGVRFHQFEIIPARIYYIAL